MSALKAYEVHDGDEGWAIVFAEKAVVARREGAQQLDIDFEEVDFCRRMKWADKYAEAGVVPMSAAIEAGWWTECHHCGQRLHEDEVWESGIEPAAVIGNWGGRVFCDWACQVWDGVQRAREEARKQRAIRWLKRRVQRRFPGVEFDTTKFGGEHAYVATDRHGRLRTEQAFVSFKFPGQKISSATLRYDPRDRGHKQGERCRPYYTCCSGDLEAFEAFVAATKPQVAA